MEDHQLKPFYLKIFELYELFIIKKNCEINIDIELKSHYTCKPGKNADNLSYII